jgi:hypothetical protein
MTDGQQLFLLFTFLYLVESLRLVPPGTWLLNRSRSGKVRLSQAFQGLDLGGRRLALLPLLPPVPCWGWLSPWQLVPSEAGLEVLAPTGPVEALLPWDKLRPVAEATTLRLGDGVTLRCPHALLAQAWADRVKRWAAMETTTARERDFMRLADDSLSTPALQAALDTQAKATAWLRVGSAGILVLCFGLLPWIYRWFGESLEVMIAAATLLVMMSVQAVIFLRASGKRPRTAKPAHAETRIPYRFWKALAMALLPQFAIRAADHFHDAHPLQAHPLAALPLLTEQDRIPLARSFWRELQRSTATSAPLQRAVLDRFFQAHGLTEAQLEEIPPQQAAAVAYCPRCLAQFRESAMRCQDCGGLELRRF